MGYKFLDTTAYNFLCDCYISYLPHPFVQLETYLSEAIRHTILPIRYGSVQHLVYWTEVYSITIHVWNARVLFSR